MKVRLLFLFVFIMTSALQGNNQDKVKHNSSIAELFTTYTEKMESKEQPGTKVRLALFLPVEQRYLLGFTLVNTSDLKKLLELEDREVDELRDFYRDDCRAMTRELARSLGLYDPKQKFIPINETTLRLGEVMLEGGLRHADVDLSEGQVHSVMYAYVKWLKSQIDQKMVEGTLKDSVKSRIAEIEERYGVTPPEYKISVP